MAEVKYIKAKKGAQQMDFTEQQWSEMPKDKYGWKPVTDTPEELQDVLGAGATSELQKKLDEYAAKLTAQAKDLEKQAADLEAKEKELADKEAALTAKEEYISQLTADLEAKNAALSSDAGNTGTNKTGKKQ